MTHLGMYSYETSRPPLYPNPSPNPDPDPDPYPKAAAAYWKGKAVAMEEELASWKRVLV